MKRKIIEINEEKCTGCGDCIPECPEGALQIIDGKARMISDLFCDGLGACINNCPEDAITIVEREAQPYDEEKVMHTIIPQGMNTIQAHIKHLKDHNQEKYLAAAYAVLEKHGIPLPESQKDSSHCNHDHHTHQEGGCPGSTEVLLRDEPQSEPSMHSKTASPSELRQWPVQLHLINPNAAYFNNAELLIVSDCVPFAYYDFHRDMLAGKTVIMFCPKLDNATETYINKLSQLFSENTVRSVTIVRMEVACCGGTTTIVQTAMKHAQVRIPVLETVISIRGEIV